MPSQSRSGQSGADSTKSIVLWVADSPIADQAMFRKWSVWVHLLGRHLWRAWACGWIADEAARMGAQPDFTKFAETGVRLYHMRRSRWVQDAISLEAQGIADGDVLVLFRGDVRKRQLIAKMLRETQTFPIQAPTSRVKKDRLTVGEILRLAPPSFPADTISDGQPLDVFISYSKDDRRMADALVRSLSVLWRERLIHVWHMGVLAPGEDWNAEIKQHLRTSQLILLLVSKDFIASDFIWSKEMKPALKRHKSGAAVVIPILLRNCDWTHTPFAALQALPSGKKPIEDWPKRAVAHADVALGIRRTIAGLRAQAASNKPAGP